MSIAASTKFHRRPHPAQHLPAAGSGAAPSVLTKKANLRRNIEPVEGSGAVRRLLSQPLRRRRRFQTPRRRYLTSTLPPHRPQSTPIEFARLPDTAPSPPPPGRFVASPGLGLPVTITRRCSAGAAPLHCSGISARKISAVETSIGGTAITIYRGIRRIRPRPSRVASFERNDTLAHAADVRGLRAQEKRDVGAERERDSGQPRHVVDAAERGHHA